MSRPSREGAGRSDNARSPLRLFSIFFAVAVVAMLLERVSVVHSYQAMRLRLAQDLRMRELAGRIAHLDEVLTMSTRMAAVTGDLAWVERYRRFQPELDEAITEAQELLGHPVQGLERVAAVNRELETLEHQALEMVGKGKLAEAQAVVLGQDYDVLKSQYEQGEEQLLAELQEHGNALLHARQQTWFWSILAVVWLLLLLAMLVTVLWMTRGWSRRMAEHNTDMERQTQALAELNRTLDRRVHERTVELAKANERLGLENAERARLEQQSRDRAGQLEQTNKELNRRETVMHSLLEDLRSTKERLEEQEQQLRAANRRLEGLAVLKDELVAKVSHELRTPLTSIKEGLSLLLDNALGATTPEQRDFVQTMDADIDRLAELINNMLDLSKIEAGRMRLQRRRVNIADLVEATVRSYRTISGKRVIEQQTNGPLPVFADTNRLLQVFGNLFSNALKFTKDDGGRIMFTVGMRGAQVAVSVQDNGPGISPEDLPKLFQKFSQVGTQNPERPRGTGLGLLLCKEFVELHHGRIEVASTLGRGTTFTVLLPAYSDAFALRESVRELLDQGGSNQTVGLVAIDAELVIKDEPERTAALERLAEEVRHSLHRGDAVLAMEPYWVVVVAAIDHDGLAAILARLRKSLAQAAQLRFGAAEYPADGKDAEALFACASTALDQGRAALQGGAGQPSSTGPRS